MSRKILFRAMVALLLLGAGAVIAQMALDSLALNETSVAAESQELQGVQGADETTMVVQKAKMRKSGAEGKKASVSMDEIHKKKLPHYRTINGALDIQKRLYSAQRENSPRAKSLAASLNQEIPKARDALKNLRVLTDQEVALINSTTKDAKAIKVAESSYSSWKSAVDHLKVEPLTDGELKARNRGIRSNSEAAVSNAHDQAKEIKSDDLSAEDKGVLKSNVVGSAKDIFSNLQQIMGEMQKVMNALGGGTGGIDVMALQGLAGSMQGVAGNMQGFLGVFGPFAQTVGGLVGESIAVPSLSIPDFSSVLQSIGGGGIPSIPSIPLIPGGKFKPPF
ncbi:MAG: hypothetical protein GX181_06040 [Synergistaceae bacterium]|nr:hypothetical protein [Synergistota bacterium]NLM71499.1 hypothetical protein [Synergistaceae bacterium]